MSNLSEFAQLDATTQAELVRQKQITPLELVDAAIERIRRIIVTVLIFVALMYLALFGQGDYPGSTN